MSKQVSLVEFNGIASAKMQYSDGSRSRKTWHVDDMQSWVEKALKGGIKVEATGKRAKARLTDILGTIPLPEEEEPKTITRYGLEIGSGMRSFETRPQAIAYHKRYGRGSALNIIDVEVKA